jgi:Mu transposase, C-terminal domain
MRNRCRAKRCRGCPANFRSSVSVYHRPIDGIFYSPGGRGESGAAARGEATDSVIMPRFQLIRLGGSGAARRFFAVSELNVVIRDASPISIGASCASWASKSRQELFEMLDRLASVALPKEPYRYSEWRRCRAAADCHIEIAGRYYSVPSRFIGEQIDARLAWSAPRPARCSDLEHDSHDCAGKIAFSRRGVGEACVG